MSLEERRAMRIKIKNNSFISLLMISSIKGAGLMSFMFFGFGGFHGYEVFETEVLLSL